MQDAFDLLPPAYARLLRGAVAGFTDEELATLIAVPPESVRPMVRLAAAKLVSLLG